MPDVLFCRFPDRFLAAILFLQERRFFASRLLSELFNFHDKPVNLLFDFMIDFTWNVAI